MRRAPRHRSSPQSPARKQRLMELTLCPAQQTAFDALTAALADGNVFVLSGGTGQGKTTVLRAVHRQTGGAYLAARDFLDAMRSRHPLAIEEAFEEIVLAALQANDFVVVDDLNLITDVVGGCGAYPRAGLINAPLTTVSVYAAQAGKKLIFGTDGHPSSPVYQQPRLPHPRLSARRLRV